jgi:hypothetical protein
MPFSRGRETSKLTVSKLQRALSRDGWYQKLYIVDLIADSEPIATEHVAPQLVRVTVAA